MVEQVPPLWLFVAYCSAAVVAIFGGYLVQRAADTKLRNDMNAFDYLDQTQSSLIFVDGEWSVVRGERVIGTPQKSMRAAARGAINADLKTGASE